MRWLWPGIANCTRQYSKFRSRVNHVLSCQEKQSLHQAQLVPRFSFSYRVRLSYQTSHSHCVPILAITTIKIAPANPINDPTTNDLDNKANSIVKTPATYPAQHLSCSGPSLKCSMSSPFILGFLLSVLVTVVAVTWITNNRRKSTDKFVVGWVSISSASL